MRWLDDVIIRKVCENGALPITEAFGATGLQRNLFRSSIIGRSVGGESDAKRAPRQNYRSRLNIAIYLLFDGAASPLQKLVIVYTSFAM